MPLTLLQGETATAETGCVKCARYSWWCVERSSTTTKLSTAGPTWIHARTPHNV